MNVLIKPFSIACFSMVCSMTVSAQNQPHKKPNIIFLFADDQNTLSVGCYGNPEVQTPNMDKLGAEGIIFDKHYNTTAICMASRAIVMTGMYEYKTGTNFNHGDMTPEIWAKSYPILLRKAGYLTGFAGKFGFQVNGHGYECGEFFDSWGGSAGQTDFATAKNPSMKEYAEKYPHATLSYGAFGQDFIKRAAKEKKPFCLSISYKAPHRPVEPDPKFDHIYKDKTFTKPSNYGREAGKHMSPQSKQGRQYERFTSWNYSDKYDQVMAKYFQQVYAIDVSVGMLRDEMVSNKSPFVMRVRESSNKGPLHSTRKVRFQSMSGCISSATSTFAGWPTSCRVLLKVKPKPKPPMRTWGLAGLVDLSGRICLQPYSASISSE